MNALVLQDAFFPPVEPRVISSLLEQHEHKLAKLRRLDALLKTDGRGIVGYFLEGNCRGDRVRPNVEEVFRLEGAIDALNAESWQRALDITGALDAMAQKRRDTWFEAIHQLKTPDFCVETVLPTLEELLSARAQYFAERVAGIFEALSGSHVTNRPEGFSKRLILADVYSRFLSANMSKAGYINDLRAVVSRFLGRDEQRWNVTFNDLDRLRERRGEWQSLDGGALRIRVYKCGTAHLELHPDMSVKLNMVLHSLYPNAIPARFRQPNRKTTKTYTVMSRPLPFAVIAVLRALRMDRSSRGERWEFDYATRSEDSRAFAEAVQVLEAIGGVREGHNDIVFEFDAREAIDQLVLSGCAPDRRSHQYYPTPDALAARVIDAAQIGESDHCLEPSAGQGALADRMPSDRTVCVELSELHSRVLRAKGHRVVQGDFLAWAQGTRERFDRVCANPPFADGRAQAHVEAAARLLRPGGILVAIVPASMRGKHVAEGCSHTWSEPIAGAFAHTSAVVTLLTLVRS